MRALCDAPGRYAFAPRQPGKSRIARCGHRFYRGRTSPERAPRGDFDALFVRRLRAGSWRRTAPSPQTERRCFAPRGMPSLTPCFGLATPEVVASRQRSRCWLLAVVSSRRSEPRQWQLRVFRRCARRLCRSSAGSGAPGRRCFGCCRDRFDARPFRGDSELIVPSRAPCEFSLELTTPREIRRAKGTTGRA